ncbi:MAG: GNAT family N-acetyltransferase [Clostridia bacterium]|nr:GNAT family N-acetyltransferase [Clostridia bacterium]
MSFSIREVFPEDAAEILEYLKTVGGETDNLTFGAEGMPASVEDERMFIESISESCNSAMFVCIDDEEVVALASVNGNLRERLKHRASVAISVRKSHWGRGIGSEMMRKLIEFSSVSGIEILSLEVRSDNLRAIGLYKKFGFQKIGSFKGFFKIDGEYIDFDLMNLYIG